MLHSYVMTVLSYGVINLRDGMAPPDIPSCSIRSSPPGASKSSSSYTRIYMQLPFCNTDITRIMSGILGFSKFEQNCLITISKHLKALIFLRSHFIIIIKDFPFDNQVNNHVFLLQNPPYQLISISDPARTLKIPGKLKNEAIVAFIIVSELL